MTTTTETKTTAKRRRFPEALATGRTPTGVVVCDADPLTDEWFAARREGITATDIPKILGESEYGNAISVWMDKRGEWPDDIGDPEAAEWGHILEPVVARKWADDHNTRALVIEMLGKKGALWMRASLDRLVLRCPLDDTRPAYTCGLEVKTRSAFVAGRWREDTPDDVLAQVAWQRVVSGVDHIHTVCLIGGQRLVEHVYHRDQALEDFIVAEATRVWQHVQDGTQPDADANALLTKVLDRLYPNRDGVIELDRVKALAAVDAYEAARVDEASAKRRKEAAKAELVQLLGANEVALVDDRPAFTYQANKNGVRSIGIARDLRKEAS